MQNPVSTAAVGPTETAPIRYVDWPAIFGGAVVGAAVAFVLSTFGTDLGLSLVSPYRGEGVPAWGLRAPVSVASSTCAEKVRCGPGF
jgi:hypothetical protein